MGPDLVRERREQGRKQCREEGPTVVMVEDEIGSRRRKGREASWKVNLGCAGVRGSG